MEDKPSPISALPLQNLAEPSGVLVEPCPSRDHLALAVTVVGAFPILTLAARNETTATSASQTKPIGIRNVPAIEPGMVLSPSLPPGAARPAP